jgi:hypothetical protein
MGLIGAAMNGSVETVRLLLDYKVDANRANKVPARLEPS